MSKREQLLELISSFESCAVAFSAGVDSTVVAKAAQLALGDKAIATFTVNEDQMNDSLARNPILVTALNNTIGYSKAAAIAKQAYAENRPILDVALEKTDLSEDELRGLLDPAKLTEGGL